MLGEARRDQGAVIGIFRSIGLPSEAQVEREIWTEEAVATAAIEGEKLDLKAVRSSVVRRLGIEGEPEGRVNRSVEGLVSVMHDATHDYAVPLEEERLARWQSALFPGGTSGLHRIAVGRYRDNDDPMQIVSGPVGRERVHYEAPASKDVPAQMTAFIEWWEASRPDAATVSIDGLVRAAIAHLWFETIHPFEDGNGRIGRALIDMALAQDSRSPHRFYSLSRQLMSQREAYYTALNDAQHGTLDVTAWVEFFLQQFRAAAGRSLAVIDGAMSRNRFWAKHAGAAINERQRKVLQRLLDAGPEGFEGGMSAEKYSGITGASKATATRDLRQLLEAGLLRQTGQGRGTRYWINA